jgi:hypothetical protein
MSESLTDFIPPKENSKPNEISPLDNYNHLLGKYVGHSKEIRKRIFSENPNHYLDESYIKVLDLERHNVHNQLKEIGITLGKSSEQIISDTLSEEGNLKEIGIDAPVIRLPLLGVTFQLDEKNQKIKNSDQNDLHLPNQKLLTPDGDKLATINQSYHPMFSSKAYGEKYSGDKSEIDKWDKKPFYSIIFAVTQDSNGMFSQPNYPLLYKTRIERMHNLAKDFNLNIFNASDVSGHQDYGPNYINGVEVSGQDLERIGLAMKNHPEKYWLTPDELKDPYKREFMEKESPKYFEAYVAKTINVNKPDSSKWVDWYNFLRLYDVLGKKDSQSENYFANYNKFIDQAIKEALLENGNVASEMKSLKQKNFPQE